MKFGTLLLLIALIYSIFSTQRAVQRSKTPQERFFAIRASAFTWLVGVLLLGAFLFLPNRQRVLLMVPAFLVVASITKLWKNSRARLQRESAAKIDLERMKRVQPAPAAGGNFSRRA